MSRDWLFLLLSLLAANNVRAQEASYYAPAIMQDSIPKRMRLVPPLPPPPPPPKIDTAFVIVEQAPLFPGCETFTNRKEAEECADQKLLTFIHGNFEMPHLAQQEHISGTAVVSFIVERNGTVSHAVVVRDPGFGIGEELVRVINLIDKKGLKFNPPRSGGRSIRVKRIIEVPIR